MPAQIEPVIPHSSAIAMNFVVSQAPGFLIAPPLPARGALALLSAQIGQRIVVET